MNLPDWPSWSLTAIVGLLIVGYFLLRRLQETEGLLQPKIKLSASPSEGIRVGIDAEYSGDGSADSVKLVLWSVEDEQGGLVHEKRESLAIFSTGNEVTPLRPGEPKRFLVAEIPNTLYAASYLALGYIVRRNSSGVDQNDFERSLAADTYLLTVRAVSTNTPETIERYRLSYTDDGMRLTLRRLASSREE